MYNFCPECGRKLRSGALFCPGCGISLTKNDDKQPDAKETVSEPKQEDSFLAKLAGTLTGSVDAEDKSGVFQIQLSSPQISELADEILSPVKIIVSKIAATFKGIISLFRSKNIKTLIPAAVIAVVWIILFSLSKNGIHGGIWDVLQILTYTRGGMDATVIGKIGGIFGKCAFVSAFMVLAGNIRSFGSGLKIVFSKENFKRERLSFLFSGAGAALIIYQFFAGEASVYDIMAGAAGMTLFSSALGSSGGTIYELVRSLTSKRSPEKKRLADEQGAAALLSGAAAGSVIGSAVSFIPFPWLPVCIGGAFVITAVAFAIINGTGKKAVQRISCFMIALLVFAAQFAFLSLNVRAEDSRTGSVGNHVSVVDAKTGKETVIGSYEMEYSVSGGRDIENSYETNIANKTVKLSAKRGETISVNYSIKFPDKVYANSRVSVFIDPEYYKSNFSKMDDYNWESYYCIQEPDKDMQRSEAGTYGSTSSGTMTYTIPKDYDSSYCHFSVDAYFAYTYKEAINPDWDRQVEHLSLAVSVNVEGDLEDDKEEDAEGGSFVLTPYSINSDAIGMKGVTYEEVSDIYDDMTLVIEKGGKFSLEVMEGRKGLVPNWEDYGSDSPAQYRPAIPGFTVSGKLDLEDGKKYKGGLAYYDKESDSYMDYYSKTIDVDKSKLKIESRKKYGVYNSFSPEEGTLRTSHHYGWTKTEPEYFEVTLTLEGLYSSSEDDGGSSYWQKWVIVFRSTGSSTTGKNKVVNVIARDDPGEDNGRTIPELIVLGGMGLLASLAGAATYSSGNEGEKRKERSRYVMYINKDFGCRLKRGYKAVYVYARICEIKHGGQEFERPKLSEKITPFAQDSSLDVQDCGMVDGYRCAKVKVTPYASTPGKAAVSFYFEGPECSFTENVIFELVGESEIFYPDKKKDEDEFIVPAILGDTDKTMVLFRTDGFFAEPEKVEIESDSDKFEVVFEKIRKFSYKAIITNKTDPPETGIINGKIINTPFAKLESANISIKAYNKDEKAESTFKIEAYPYGISARVVTGEEKDGMLLVETEDEDGKFKPTEVEFIRAYRKANGTVVKDGKVSVDDELTLTRDDEASTHVYYGFKYKIEPFKLRNKEMWRILPEVTLPPTDKDCYTFGWFAFTVIATESAAIEYELRMPVRLVGESAEHQRLHDKTKEIELLKRAIDRYGLHGNATAINLEENLQNVPISLIREMRYTVLKCANEYYTEEASKQKIISYVMGAGFYVASGLDWLGQQAFSYAVKCWLGDTAEMIITPIKNAMVQTAVNNMYKYWWDIPYDESDIIGNNLATWNKVTAVFEEIAENFLIDALFGSMDWDDVKTAGEETWKHLKNFRNISVSGIKASLLRIAGAKWAEKSYRAGAFLAVFALLNFTKHMCLDEETKGDYGLSILATINDCTVTTVKQIFSKFVQNWIKKRFGTQTVSRNTDGSFNVESSVCKPLEDWVKAHISFGDAELFGQKFSSNDFQVFGKKYKFLNTGGDSFDTGVGQIIDGATGSVVDNAGAIAGAIKFVVWDFSVGICIIGLGKVVYKFTLGAIVDIMFQKISNQFGLEDVAVKEPKELPAFVPPGDDKIIPN